ncbi:MAG TPA: hypothetical protein P5089_00760 [Candidatus Portnoybacteria bacterium]|nr:hypothetical protein [Candidatus Portnoybacteria bacterium]
MDIKKIGDYLLGYKWVFVFAVFVAIAAAGFAWQGDKYSASLALTIGRSGTQNAVDYKYDNYYALKASDEFGSTVVGWFKTPEMAQAVYRRAQIDLGQASLDSLSRQFLAAKISPNTVEVRFSADTPEKIAFLGPAIASVVAEKANKISASSDQGVDFSVTGGEVVVVDNSSNIYRNFWAGLLGGFILGFFIKSAKEYFKE